MGYVTGDPDLIDQTALDGDHTCVREMAASYARRRDMGASMVRLSLATNSEQLRTGTERPVHAADEWSRE
jgi:hypothetical protein